jgi:hypothetical protein
VQVTFRQAYKQHEQLKVLLVWECLIGERFHYLLVALLARSSLESQHTLTRVVLLLPEALPEFMQRIFRCRERHLRNLRKYGTKKQIWFIDRHFVVQEPKR